MATSSVPAVPWAGIWIAGGSGTGCGSTGSGSAGGGGGAAASAPHVIRTGISAGRKKNAGAANAEMYRWYRDRAAVREEHDVFVSKESLNVREPQAQVVSRYKASHHDTIFRRGSPAQPWQIAGGAQVLAAAQRRRPACPGPPARWPNAMPTCTIARR